MLYFLLSALISTCTRKDLPDISFIMSLSKACKEGKIVVTSENAHSFSNARRKTTLLEENALLKPEYEKHLRRLKDNFSTDTKRHSLKVIRADTSNKEVVAYLDLDRRIKSSILYPSPYLSDLIVHPSWRRKGFAKALVEDAILTSEVEWKEKNPISLWVEESNDAAVLLYTNLGFIIAQRGDNIPVKEATSSAAFLNDDILNNFDPNDRSQVDSIARQLDYLEKTEANRANERLVAGDKGTLMLQKYSSSSSSRGA